MNNMQVTRAAFQLLGITGRTNNQNEMDPHKAIIGTMMQHYWSNNLANDFCHRLNPGVTYAVYTNYASDEHGEYTYFLGEVVGAFDNQKLDQFQTLTIAASNYQLFTPQPDVMPGVIIHTWQAIWAMSELKDQRSYQADFEVYDQRAANPASATADIYVGIAQKS